jgi:hypothetical protein
MLFHGSSRRAMSRLNAVALPFTRMFDRRTGEPRFESRAALCEAFKVSETASVILSGTDADAPIEAWWGIGREARIRVARNLKAIGVKLITSPNYSLFTDQPRWDDLHSMKRIAIAHNELLGEGLQAALHVNGRTQKDFERWAEYIADRPEIEILAYEFTTGPGWIGRREIHVAWLTKLAQEVGRPLQLVVRGGIELLPDLLSAFGNVTFVDTAAFMRTIKRRRAVLMESGRLVWRAAPTASGEPLDDLLAANITTVTSWILDQLAPCSTLRLSA